MKKFFLILSCISLFLLPSISMAQDKKDANSKVIEIDNVIKFGTKANDDSVDIDTVTTGLVQLLRVMFGAIGVLAIFPIVIGGLRFITSQASGGGSDSINAAKQTIFWGIIGIVVAFSGLIVIQFVLQVFIQ